MGENWQSFRQMGGPQSPQGINPDTDLNKKQKTKNKKTKKKMTIYLIFWPLGLKKKFVWLSSTARP